jgi:hypothetical protein
MYFATELAIGDLATNCHGQVNDATIGLTNSVESGSLAPSSSRSRAIAA